MKNSVILVPKIDFQYPFLGIKKWIFVNYFLIIKKKKFNYKKKATLSKMGSATQIGRK